MIPEVPKSLDWAVHLVNAEDDEDRRRGARQLLERMVHMRMFDEWAGFTLEWENSSYIDKVLFRPFATVEVKRYQHQ